MLHDLTVQKGGAIPKRTASSSRVSCSGKSQISESSTPNTASESRYSSTLSKRCVVRGEQPSSDGMAGDESEEASEEA